MIAILGWGSLVWDPRTLQVHPQWRADGPGVRVEFLRQSNNGRLTLVLSPAVEPIRSLWAAYAGSDLAQARENLREREGIPRKHLEKHIGIWSRGDANPACVLGLESWADARGVQSVVWTALPPKFAGIDGIAPTAEEAVSYLSGLMGPVRIDAEQYIRRAPPQVNTAYRRRIEAALGWSHTPMHGVGL